MQPLPSGPRWPVLMASRALKQLRKLERDQKVLDVVNKKLIELSYGKFTFENHRAVVGTEELVPIYRTRVAVDLRIIYQIDLAVDSSRTHDHQIIRVFVIQTRAQVDYAFWVEVSKYLVTKGPLYQTRCTSRLFGVAPEYQPAMFPHEEYAGGAVQLPSLDEGDDAYSQHALQDQIQDATGLERYAPFSKTFYNTIRADVDIYMPLIPDDQEREIIYHTGATIVVGRSGTGKTTALLHRMHCIDQAIKTYEDSNARQLFVTRSPVLARHVESTYRMIVQSAEIRSKSKSELLSMANQAKSKREIPLVQFDHTLDLRNDLPSRFSQLEQSNFPLFISFDTLCTLLEGDLPPRDYRNRGGMIKQNFIGYTEFYEQYWPQISMGLTCVVDPVLAYSEIMGVIKGSLAIQETSQGFLSRIQYTELLYRRILSQLTASTREIIYSIFEQYQNLKVSRFELDPADRTLYILRNLDKFEEKPCVDYLYVDEVQDNLMLDVYLLRKLCPDINGTYWGGDTAQTIVAGSSFRISDLGSFIYIDIQNTLGEPSSSVVPSFSTFHLTRNFRSQSGIVRCATSIIERIYQLFPDSIDWLPTETPIHTGPPPIFFTDSKEDDSFFKTFVLGTNPSSQIGFGAQQAIIVRSPEMVDLLDLKLQGICSVVTIADCKGLEFDDVLIYDFFKSSTIPLEDWEFVTGLPEHKKKNEANLVVPPTLCMELKLFYVGITRARKRCWIWDSGEVCDAIKSYLLDKNLIVTASATKMIGRIAISSTPAQWVDKGREYFSHGLYKTASGCFKNAGREADARMALAYHQMSQAKLISLRRDTEASRLALVSAAHSLQECAIESTGNSKHLWFHAGSCLESAHQPGSAAKALVRGGFCKRAIALLFAHDLYDQGSELLLRYWNELESSSREALLEECRCRLFEAGEYRLLAQVFGNDVEAQIRFAHEHGYIAQLKTLMEDHQQLDELAAVHIQEGDITKGVEFFLESFEANGRATSIEAAASAIIEYAESILLWHGRYREIPRRTLVQLTKLISPYAESTSAGKLKWLDFLEIFLTKPSLTLHDARMWSLTDPLERALAILALHFALKNIEWLGEQSLEVAVGHIYAWSVYIYYTRRVANEDQPASVDSTRRLLGLILSTSNTRLGSEVRILKDSCLNEPAQRCNVPIRHNDAGEFVISAQRANSLIRSEVTSHVQNEVQHMVLQLLESRWTMTPDLSIDSDRTPFYASLRERLYVISYSMKCFQAMRSLTPKDTRFNLGQLLVRRLHETIYPLNGMELNYSLLYSFQNQRELLDAILYYVQHDLQGMNPKECRPIEFFGCVIRNLGLLAILDRSILSQIAGQRLPYKIYSNYTRRSGCSTNPQPVGVDITRFFEAKFSDSLTRGIYALQHMIESTAQMDAPILVYFIETITREIIFNLCAGNSKYQDGFSNLLLPLSWSKSLAKTQAATRITRDVWPLDSFIQVLQHFSSEMKFGERDRWFVGDSWLCNQTDVLHELNLRLCKCVALLALNLGPQYELALSALRGREGIARNVKLLGYKYRHTDENTPYDRFTTVTTRLTCFNVLQATLKADQMILLSNRREILQLEKLSYGARVVPYNSVSAVHSVLEKI
ncbi:UvrD-like helicase carboxy-terminal domain protein [Ceratobasidium sp. AG-Ba]|nr:UvrD-like helicase carboxy-terminal domain protein [Ceratobasidium sp. AG-Ba]